MRFLSRVGSRLTYANVTATLALFIALGGVSWAATKLPRNSVGSKQIKRSAVASSEVKNGSLTGADLKRGTLTGKSIDENSLGTVPAAKVADVAKSSADRFQVVKREPISITNADLGQARANATVIPLASHGPITVYGKCFAYATYTYANVFVSTAVDGSFGTAASSGDFLAGPALNTSTTETARMLVNTVANDLLTNHGGGGGVYLSPDGVGMSIGVTTAVLNGAPQPSLYFPAAKSCVFIAEGSYIG